MKWKHAVGAFSASTVGDCKRIVVSGPSNFELGIEIDNDDVDPETVHEQTEFLLAILNTHWPLL